MSLTHSTQHAADMDANYRLQRHIYDATRKYYLLGRDHLIDELAVPDHGTVLEIGCGTGRNLILAAKRYPTARLYGLDISRAMLEVTEDNIRRAGLEHRIRISRADAAAFDPEFLFGEQAFDRVFLSYTLSMIPPWHEALVQGFKVTAEGDSLHVVDFGDQSGLPRTFRRALFAWLAKFQVTPRADLDVALEDIAASQGAALTREMLFRDYARYARLERTKHLPSPDQLTR